MAPGQQIDEVMILRQRLAEAEAAIGRESQLAEEHFREILDTAPIMIWLSGTDAMCTFFNRCWLEFRGRRMEEEMGNGWTEGLHPDDRDLCVETYLKAFSARQPFRVQYRLQKANGDYSWVEENGTPRFQNGAFIGFMGTGIDVSDRRRRAFTPDEQSVRHGVFAHRTRTPSAGPDRRRKLHQGGRRHARHQLQDGRFAPQPDSRKAGCA